jgi:AmiR/NasT family two-component response regulator
MNGRPSAPLNVLIIEDEAVLVMDMEAVVQDAGHNLFGDVASVYELQAFDSAEAPDLAFVDINLAKGTSGLDASMIVRERWTNAFIVFVTANPGKIPEGHAGSHGVIVKPFTQKGLTAALEYICQGMCTPPPTVDLPASFIPFPAFAESCAN